MKSIASAEVLAVGKAIDESLIIKAAFEKLVGIEVELNIIVDSKDLFTSLSTCRVPEDKSIRADVQLIRYCFETKKIENIIWIPGAVNPADPLTKKDSPILESLQIMLYQGEIPLDLSREKRNPLVNHLAKVGEY